MEIIPTNQDRRYDPKSFIGVEEVVLFLDYGNPILKTTGIKKVVKGQIINTNSKSRPNSVVIGAKSLALKVKESGPFRSKDLKNILEKPSDYNPNLRPVKSPHTYDYPYMFIVLAARP